MREIIRKAIVATATALAIAGAVISTSVPAEAAFRSGGGGFHGGGFGGGWHGGGFGGWRGGYGGWRGGYGGWRGYGYGYPGWSYAGWGPASWACPGWGWGWGCGWGPGWGWGWAPGVYAGDAVYGSGYAPAPGCLVRMRVWTGPGRRHYLGRQLVNVCQ